MKIVFAASLACALFLAGCTSDKPSPEMLAWARQEIQRRQQAETEAQNLQAAHVSNSITFQKLQALLASKIFGTIDDGNNISEKITIEQKGGLLILHQTLSASGPEGIVSHEIVWSLTASMLISAKIQKQEFSDQTIKVSLLSGAGIDEFRFEGGTRMMRNSDNRMDWKSQSGKSDRLGISFQNQSEVSNFMTLYNAFIAELKRG